MLRSESLVGLVALGALALNAAPAAAQVEAQTQEVHAYGGELFGDDLTDTDVSGWRPKLDDDVTYGIRHGYNFTDRRRVPSGTSEQGAADRAQPRQ